MNNGKPKADELREIDDLIARLSRQADDHKEEIEEVETPEKPFLVEEKKEIKPAPKTRKKRLEETVELSLLDDEEVNDVKLMDTSELETINEKKPISKSSIFKTFSKQMMIFSSLFIPVLIVILAVGRNSNELISANMVTTATFMLGFFVGIFIFGFIMFLQKIKTKKAKKMASWKKVIYASFMILYIAACSSFIFVLYGPVTTFRDWFIVTSMETEEYQRYSRWFYSEEQIEEVMNKNQSEYKYTDA